MILQSGPKMGPPFSKLFAKNLVLDVRSLWSRVFLAPPLDGQLARLDMTGPSAGAA